MGKKQISVVHVSSPMSWRGGEQQLAYLLNELDKRGVEQLVVCPIGSEMEKYCRTKSIQFRSLKKRSGVDPVFARQLKGICRKRGADIVHAHDSHAHTMSILASDLFGSKIPIVVNRRVVFPVGSSLFSKHKYNHKRIAAIICVSNPVKKEMEKVIKKKDLLRVIHSGVPLDKFKGQKGETLRHKFAVFQDKKFVGNVAALTGEKDYATFIKTANILKEKGLNAHYFIAGDGKLESKLKDMVKKLDLMDDVTFLGFIPNVSRVLTSLDLLLFTSKKEGLGTAVLDAFLMKVPVVSTKAGGVVEIIDHEENGYLTEVGDAETLAEKAWDLLNDDEKRKHFIANATKKVKEFSVEITGEKVHELYSDILENQ
jgi:glycosyltransferase involved in cell wall biosynthesis